LQASHHSRKDDAANLWEVYSLPGDEPVAQEEDFSSSNVSENLVSVCSARVVTINPASFAVDMSCRASARMKLLRKPDRLSHTWSKENGWFSLDND
jgi:hypothetical protein